MTRALSLSFFMSLLLITVGCATKKPPGQAGEVLIAQGNVRDGLALLREAMGKHSDDLGLRATYYTRLDAFVGQLLKKADSELEAQNYEQAAQGYQNVLRWVPGLPRALAGLKQIEVNRQIDTILKQAESQSAIDALALVKQAVALNPHHAQAKQRYDTLAREMQALENKRSFLNKAMRMPIALRFENQPLMRIFDVISRAAKINFIFDRDVSQDLRGTIFTENTTVEDAIKVLLITNQLAQKVLNDHTLLIYPKQIEKERIYKELSSRTFYLSHADPKQMILMLRQTLQTRYVYFDARLNTITVRDTPDALSVAERLIAAQDLPQPEVIFDLEILEVAEDDLLNLGINYPGTSSNKTLIGADITAGLNEKGEKKPVMLSTLRNLTSSNILFNGLSISANLLRASTQTTVLANPRIRVKNKEKATVTVGNKLPTIAVATSSSNSVATDNISYQDVGLNLTVEPKLVQNGEVEVKVSLEVSNNLGEVESKSGSIAYKIGRRKAETYMSVKDGETQVLAGLISREKRSSSSGLPFLSSIPILNRIFGSKKDDTKRSQVVLLITPRIVRDLPILSPHITNFPSGTLNDLSTKPLLLRDSHGPLDVKGSPTAPSGFSPRSSPRFRSDPLPDVHSDMLRPLPILPDKRVLPPPPS